MMNQLNVAYDNPSFKVPELNIEVVYFCDTPHLLKLTRNWLLDYGFSLPNGEKVTKEPLEKLVGLTSTEVNVCHKLIDIHVNVKGFQGQKVSYATQLLSHTTATALTHYKAELGCDINLISSTAQFIEIIDKWFDLFNTRIPGDGKYTPYFQKAYGKDVDIQNQLLDEIAALMIKMRPINARTSGMQLFQKGIIQNANALKILYSRVKNSGIRYIININRIDNKNT